MPRTFDIVINRDAVHAIEPAVSSYETVGDFAIVLENEGQATHVHLHLDDDLARIASLPNGNNYFVEAGKSRSVQVSVGPGHRPITGRVKVVTGYGAETKYVDVSVIDEVDQPRSVAVDERLSVKQPRPEATQSPVFTGTAAVVGLVLIAIGLAIAAMLIAGSAAVFLGASVVVLAVAFAIYLLMVR